MHLSLYCGSTVPSKTHAAFHPHCCELRVKQDGAVMKWSGHKGSDLRSRLIYLWIHGFMDGYMEMNQMTFQVAIFSQSTKSSLLWSSFDSSKIQKLEAKCTSFKCQFPDPKSQKQFFQVKVGSLALYSTATSICYRASLSLATAHRASPL